MPNIIISEASGRFGQLYGDLQAPLASFIENQAARDKASCLGLKIFSERRSDSFAEAYGGMTGADKMQPVGEGAIAPMNGVDTRDPKTIVNETWKSLILLTREIVDDCHGDMKKIAQRLGAHKLSGSYYETVDDFLFGLLGAAIQNREYYSIGNKKFNTHCYDGNVVFSKKHKGGVNVYSDGFTKESLGELSTMQQNFTDEKGNTIDLSPDTILIPNTYAAKAKVFEVIGAEKDPGTANNGFNYMFGQWNVVISPRLNKLVTADDAFPYVLLDSNFNESNDGNVFQNRVDLEVTSGPAEGGNNKWEGYARFSGGFVDWRQMILGGVSWGEKL